MPPSPRSVTRGSRWASPRAGDLDVIFGAGHPYFDDDNEALSTGDYGYISPEAYEQVSSGDATLHYERSGTSQLPGDVAKNDVADLSVMSEAALNVLGQNDTDGSWSA